MSFVTRQRGNSQLLRVPPNVHHQSKKNTAGITDETLEGISYIRLLAAPGDGLHTSARIVRIEFIVLIRRD